jgi:hypothetical protein
MFTEKGCKCFNSFTFLLFNLSNIKTFSVVCSNHDSAKEFVVKTYIGCNDL